MVGESVISDASLLLLSALARLSVPGSCDIPRALVENLKLIANN